ncbi:MAG: hypothetical protein ISS65_00205 [Desulfobacterales bacterium]|uniref:Uncharacterized protein n=1 Tax=Candidatus Desulfatibia profunda TaxID=2841695 RepID=A0A8J6NR36_9BACT|nr:hypothetical protein [Candidatus Desulfatibia profunda]MBL7178619.1 hypothetical protein [Desulfobacterales bacterium]
MSKSVKAVGRIYDIERGKINIIRGHLFVCPWGFFGPNEREYPGDNLKEKEESDMPELIVFHSGNPG